MGNSPRILFTPILDTVQIVFTTINNSSIDIFLNELGEYIKKQEKEIFGSSLLAANSPSKGANTPLVLTGDLKDKVAHRISGGAIKT